MNIAPAKSRYKGYGSSQWRNRQSRRRFLIFAPALNISKGYRPTWSKPNPLDNKKFIYYFEANDAVQQIIDAYEPEQDAEADYVESFAKEVADYADSLNNTTMNAKETENERKVKELRENGKNLFVKSAMLAQRIVSAGYFGSLRSVRPDKEDSNKRVFFFEPDVEIMAIMDEYFAEASTTLCK